MWVALQEALSNSYNAYNNTLPPRPLHVYAPEELGVQHLRIPGEIDGTVSCCA